MKSALQSLERCETAIYLPLIHVKKGGILAIQNSKDESNKRRHILTRYFDL